ncbi:MAG TPA: sugar MFS transporter [Povalibacter sp.]|uniref:sugar MFS transporter n=1 Tax=Povalibacter sp. TaxID=1962978 RepID=UPI002D1344CB|nr:sugar MFS transporter [Povalibacter sp.]HMN43983.1 sugar MFS transporter [Povalibacter sp.]
MAYQSTTTTSTTANNQQTSYLSALIVLTSLFFMWGLITSLNDILIPHLKAAFSLSYVKVMLIQFCFFGAYAVMSLPSGFLVERAGYKRGIIIGLVTAGIGCLLFFPAAGMQSYPFFLGALFVLASGITLLQVAANPYVAILGPPRTASSRLTLTQAFNSLGTTIGPFLGSVLILSAVRPEGDEATVRAAEAATVQGPYVILALTLFVIAVLIALVKLPQIEAQDQPADAGAGTYQQHKSVWGYRHLVLGAVGIFLYVGAEVSIGSFAVNFLSQPTIGGLTEVEAGKYLSYYWGGAMVGRFIGAWVMTKVKPGRVLAFNAFVAVGLLLVVMLFAGKTAMWALLAIGLFNSIMFPTIFTLAIDGLGKHTGEASGILCVAIVGGAIIPLLQGYFADINLLYSFIVPAVCYLYIAYYGLKGHKADLKPAA